MRCTSPRTRPRPGRRFSTSSRATRWPPPASHWPRQARAASGSLGAALAMVIGRSACRVAEADAPGFIAGWTLRWPIFPLPPAGVTGFYRPSVRFRARDPVLPARARCGCRRRRWTRPDAVLRVAIDGTPVHEARVGTMQRSAARLLAEVSAFMTPAPGRRADAGRGPRRAARAGGAGLHDRTVPAWARWPGRWRHEDRPRGLGRRDPRRRAAPAGAAAGQRPRAGRGPGGLAAAHRAGHDHRAGAEHYADHVKELAKELTVTAKDEPLVFLKTAGSVVGHRGCTPRPADAAFMHYECELAVVIGRTAARVKAADRDGARGRLHRVQRLRGARLTWKTGTRPNLRVKNRDGRHRARALAGRRRRRARFRMPSACAPSSTASLRSRATPRRWCTTSRR